MNSVLLLEFISSNTGKFLVNFPLLLLFFPLMPSDKPERNRKAESVFPLFLRLYFERTLSHTLVNVASFLGFLSTALRTLSAGQFSALPISA
jgi:hypothetical protein